MKRTTAMLWAFALGLAPTGWAAAQSEGYPPAGQPPFQPPPQPIYGEQQANPSYPVPYNPEGDAIDDGGEYQPDDPDAEQQVAADNQAAETYDDGYDPQAYTQFEGALSPYGSWVDDPTYGRIWSPSSAIVGAGFVPYGDGGRWVQSEYGWTWVSQWDWGWAPFHYGRWVSGASGWGWVPGRVWGPGWVSWRYGGGYAGWAALPPRGVRIGPPTGTRNAWRFVVGTQIGAPRPAFLPANVVPSVFGRTSVVSNARTMNAGALTVRVNAGPSVPIFGRAAPLRSIAPQALPRFNITPRAGVPVATRPWVRSGAAVQNGGWGAPRTTPVSPGWQSHPVTPSRPLGPTRLVPQPTSPYHLAPAHSYYPPPQTGPRTVQLSSGATPAPRYYGAATYMPRYSAYATPHESAPVPAQHYAAPAPAPSYSTPSHASAPSYSAPPSHSSGGGGHHR